MSTNTGKRADRHLLQQIAATAIICRIRDLVGVGYGTREYNPEQTGQVT